MVIMEMPGIEAVFHKPEITAQNANKVTLTEFSNS